MVSFSMDREIFEVKNMFEYNINTEKRASFVLSTVQTFVIIVYYKKLSLLRSNIANY